MWDGLDPGGDATGTECGEEPPASETGGGSAGGRGPCAVELWDEVKLVPDGPQDHAVEVAGTSSDQFNLVLVFETKGQAYCRI